MRETLLPDQTLIRFDNGLRLLVDPMPGVKTFALNALIHGGTRFETEVQGGWSHLLEHMVFKGAGGRDARSLAEAIEHKGGTINASTGYEHTRFEVRGLKALLPLALEIVTDLMFRATLDAEELKREKKVVEQEINEAFDTPDDHVFDLLQEAMFESQALGRPILGTRQSLKGAEPDLLRDFAGRLYAPHRIVICVSGGVTAEDVLAIARPLIDTIAPREGFGDPERLHFTPGQRLQRRRIEQANMALGFDALSRYDADIIPLRLFSEILGGGMASRLFQEAREERGLAYTIESWCTPYRDGGVFGIYAGCAAGDVPQLFDLVLRVLGDLAADPSPRELERARAQFQTTLFLNHENAASRAATFASQVSTFGKVFTLDEVEAGIAGVSRDDLHRVGQALATQTQRARALLGPPSLAKLAA
jgi:predicted Zn-dependent peptidase